MKTFGVDDLAMSIRNDQPDDAAVKKASARVWANLEQEMRAKGNALFECRDMEQLIAPYLAGDLPEARVLLLRDHAQSCVACHRALKAARDQGSTLPGTHAKRRNPMALVALAAAIFLALGVVWFGLDPLSPPAAGEATLIAGEVFNPAGVALAQGESLSGAHLATRGGAGATLQLADGELELAPRSSLLLGGPEQRAPRLEKGAMIVNAHAGKTQTIIAGPYQFSGGTFALSHGASGTRVTAVAEALTILGAGESVALDEGEQWLAGSGRVSRDVTRQISWSHDADRYRARLQAAIGKRAALDPSLRTRSSLMPKLGGNVAFYAAVPNRRLNNELDPVSLRRFIDENQILAEWWQSTGTATVVRSLLAADFLFSGLVDHLGDERVYAAAVDKQGLFNGVVGLARYTDSLAFQQLLSERVGQPFMDEPGSEFVLVENHLQELAEGPLFVWAGQGYVLATTNPQILRQTVTLILAGEEGAFVGTDLYGRLNEGYADGIQQILGVELEAVRRRATHLAGHLERLGFADAEFLILRNWYRDGQTGGDAVISFNGPRRGMASWLAEPGEMGSLGFISPDASLFAGMVYKDPTTIFNEFEQIMGQLDDKLQSETENFRSSFGFKLLRDVAPNLGSEFALAVDGPILPVPAWKLVVEVYNEAAVQAAVEGVVSNYNASVNTTLMRVESSEVDGHTFYAFSHGTQGGFAYTFEEGYLILAPKRDLLITALANRTAGYSMAGTGKVRALMGAEAGESSALFYENLGSLQATLGALLGDTTSGTNRGPTLAFARAESDAIVFLTRGNQDPLSSGLMSLFYQKGSN